MVQILKKKKEEKKTINWPTAKNIGIPRIDFIKNNLPTTNLNSFTKVKLNLKCSIQNTWYKFKKKKKKKRKLITDLQ